MTTYYVGQVSAGHGTEERLVADAVDWPRAVHYRVVSSSAPLVTLWLGFEDTVGPATGFPGGTEGVVPLPPGAELWVWPEGGAGTSVVAVLVGPLS